MTVENSAEKACGQVLICLKMSKLNYMVKETPFSAYVTIRKKFLNSYQIEHEDPLRFDQDDTVKKMNKLGLSSAKLRTQLASPASNLG